MSPTSFPQTLERHGIRYSLLDSPEPDRARFAFTGSFAGCETLWDTTLVTLRRHLAGSACDPVAARPFLEIGADTGHGRPLTVALDIAVVDEPAILRTIIMLRQYKRLRVGRFEFGIAHGFAEPG